jgi:hypothetical protein
LTAAQGFQLHPDAAQEITEIWQFIARKSCRCLAFCSAGLSPAPTLHI